MLKELLLWLAFIGSFFLFATLAISIMWIPFLWLFSPFGLALCFIIANRLIEENKNEKQ